MGSDCITLLIFLLCLSSTSFIRIRLRLNRVISLLKDICFKMLEIKLIHHYMYLSSVTCSSFSYNYHKFLNIMSA